MYGRSIEGYLKKVSRLYPVITITGPRQSGKTTLAKKTFADKNYVNLEDPDTREFARNDPRGFFDTYKNGLIIDEVQRVPELMSYIQVIVDKQKQKSMFILTGSQNFSLLSSVTQSLAGRTAVLELLPFSLDELMNNYYTKKQVAINDLIFQGFYPGIYDMKIEPNLFYANYTKTYVERDLRQLSKITNLDLFQRFIKLCAGRIAQVFNASALSEELGVSYHTAQEWFSLLRASYIAYTLPAFHPRNIKKQIIKSPKLYFYDTGLASYLLDIHNHKQISNHYMHGALFENFIVTEIMKLHYNHGLPMNLSFYRDKSKEVDLIYKHADQLIAIEIKSSKTFHENFYESLDYFEKITNNKYKINQKAIIYGGEAQSRTNISLHNPFSMHKLFSS